MFNRLRWIAIVGICASLLGACAEDDLRVLRAQKALNATVDTPIVIGLVWPFYAAYDQLPQGVRMAVEEINANGGLLGGRPLRLIEADDFDSVREGRLVAQEFAENTDMVAVIGHAWSYISVPASPIYEFNGLVMLSPSSTSPELTRNGFQFIFRNVSSDEEIARQLAIYAESQGYARMTILHVNDPNGRQLANIFENEADRRGINVVDRRSYQGTNRNFRTIIANWQSLDFDAIFIAGSNPEAAEFILQARTAGIEAPIMGSDGLDTDDLWNIAGEAAEGTVVVSHYHPDTPREQQQRFIEKYRQRYSTDPDTWAAQGYDAVYLLAHAMTVANSSSSGAIAQALHQTREWQGVTGPHTFNERGDVVGKPIILKILQNGTFDFYQIVNVADEADSAR